MRINDNHDLEMHKFTRIPRKKKGLLPWIKRQFMAEEMTDRELGILFLQCLLSVPLVIVFTWLLFAGGYAAQGIWPW